MLAHSSLLRYSPPTPIRRRLFTCPSPLQRLLCGGVADLKRCGGDTAGGRWTMDARRPSPLLHFAPHMEGTVQR